MRYEYGVASPGVGIQPQAFRKHIALNRDGSDSDTGEWSTTFTDSHGRAWRTLRSYKDGQPAISSTYYDDLGRTVRSVDPDGVTTLHAYFKDDDRERTIQAIDMNHNGHIDYDGTDRIVETTTELVELTPEQREQRKTSSLQNSASPSQHPVPSLIRRATTRVWTTDDDDTATRIVSITESTLDGDQSWQSTNGREASSHTEQTGPGSEVRTRIAPDGTRTVTYNENRREVRRETFSFDGELLRSVAVEHNEFGRIATRITSDSEGTVIVSQTYHYDSLGRVVRGINQKGSSYANAYNADGTIAATTITVDEHAQTTRFLYDVMGRRAQLIRPDGHEVRYAYWPTGETKQVEGAGTDTTRYIYTDQGRLSILTTTAGNTHWQYDAAGQLQRKVYLDGSDVDYEYSPGSKLTQRTSARGIVTFYQYTSAGDLERVDYSDDNTAPVVYGFDRLGQNTSVVHSNSTTINQYNVDGGLARQSTSGGPLDGVTLQQEFNDKGQRTQFTAELPHKQSVVHLYGYDRKGRMQTVRQDNRQATYSYNEETGQLTTTRVETAGQTIAETTREFDDFERLTSIETRSLIEDGDFHQSFDYTYNDANQRTRVTMSDGGYWDYGYDDLGQVVSARKYFRDGAPVAGQQFQYAFDSIGNRESARYGGDAKGENLSEITYTTGGGDGASDPTQTGTVDHPGVTYVTGSANEDATVTVNGESAERQGNYFSAPVSFDNAEGASIEDVTIAASEDDDVNRDSDNTTRRTHIPARSTRYLYDADGNLLFDGRWHYQWDAENRLITMRAVTESMRNARQLELLFSYDHAGRRISKRVIESIDGQRRIAKDQRFVYDGWNLIAELDTTGRATRTHLWGLDLSESQQGAGGIGGLLSTATADSAVFLSFDGNGSVVGELDHRTGRVMSTASYDAFGKMVEQEFARTTPFEFSTKFMDDEAGHLYYGFRYYDPTHGRWLSRDPIGEAGGLNLYGFAGNDAVNQIDYLGLALPAAAWVAIEQVLWPVVEFTLDTALDVFMHAVHKYFSRRFLTGYIREACGARESELEQDRHDWYYRRSVPENIGSAFTSFSQNLVSSVKANLAGALVGKAKPVKAVVDPLVDLIRKGGGKWLGRGADYLTGEEIEGVLEDVSDKVEGLIVEPDKKFTLGIQNTGNDHCVNYAVYVNLKIKIPGFDDASHRIKVAEGTIAYGLNPFLNHLCRLKPSKDE